MNEMRSAPAGFDPGRAFGAVIQHYRSGRSVEAEALCREIVANAPDHTDALHMLGVFASQRGEYETAIELIGRAISLTAAKPVAQMQNNIGLAYRGLGREDEAVGHFKQALAIAPNLAEAHTNLGLVAQKAGRLDEAIGHIQTAISFRPDDAVAYSYLGDIQRVQGKLDAAISSYRQALTLRPDYADVHSSLGVAFMEQGKLADAASRFERALNLRPNDAAAHGNLGLVLREQGNAPAAIARFERAVALDPENTEGFYNLGLVLQEQGRLEDAKVNYERAAALGSPMARHMAAALRGETTEGPPLEYVVNLFDAYAGRFEAHLVGALKYASPQILRRMIDGVGHAPRFAATVDLGCGTGLMGVAFRDLTDRLVGIDLAPKMIGEAARKGVYDRLETAEIVEFLNRCTEKFDLFLAAELLIYLGALEPLFSAMAKRAAPGAILAFSAEISSGPDYELTPPGRYAQSRSYLEAQLRSVGGKALAWESQTIRVNDGREVAGYHVIATLNG